MLLAVVFFRPILSPPSNILLFHYYRACKTCKIYCFVHHSRSFFYLNRKSTFSAFCVFFFNTAQFSCLSFRCLCATSITSIASDSFLPSSKVYVQFLLYPLKLILFLLLSHDLCLISHRYDCRCWLASAQQLVCYRDVFSVSTLIICDFL